MQDARSSAACTAGYEVRTPARQGVVRLQEMGPGDLPKGVGHSGPSSFLLERRSGRMLHTCGSV